MSKSENMEVEAHFVYQCAGCRTILGDSEAWDCANEALCAVSLRGTSLNVKTGKGLETSTEGPDYGSTYHRLNCGTCGKLVGRFYKTTPTSLEFVKDKFNLFVDELVLYELGSGLAPVEAAGQMPLTFSKLQTQVQKVQVILLSMNKRLENIEHVLMEEGEDINLQDLNFLKK